MDINNRKQNEISPAVMVLILLFFLFPPLAIIGAIFYAAYKQGKKNPSPEKRSVRTEIENLKRSGKTAKLLPSIRPLPATGGSARTNPKRDGHPGITSGS